MWGLNFEDKYIEVKPDQLLWDILNYYNKLE